MVQTITHTHTSACSKLGFGRSVSRTMETKSLSSSTSLILSSGSKMAPLSVFLMSFTTFQRGDNVKESADSADMRWASSIILLFGNTIWKFRKETSSLLGTKDGGRSFRYRFKASSPSQRTFLNCWKWVYVKMVTFTDMKMSTLIPGRAPQTNHHAPCSSPKSFSMNLF